MFSLLVLTITGTPLGAAAFFHALVGADLVEASGFLATFLFSSACFFERNENDGFSCFGEGVARGAGDFFSGDLVLDDSEFDSPKKEKGDAGFGFGGGAGVCTVLGVGFGPPNNDGKGGFAFDSGAGSGFFGADCFGLEKNENDGLSGFGERAWASRRGSADFFVSETFAFVLGSGVGLGEKKENDCDDFETAASGVFFLGSSFGTWPFGCFGFAPNGFDNKEKIPPILSSPKDFAAGSTFFSAFGFGLFDFCINF